MPNKVVLVVDDDPHIREVLRYALEKEGIIVYEAENGRTGLEKVTDLKPDVIILDVLMPEMSGIDMCKELRKTSQVPIVFLSSMDDELDKILGLEMGGDDYVTKPFSPRELVARIKVIFKRLSSQNPPSENQPNILIQGHIQINLTTYQVTWKDNLVILTATEFNLLQVFLRHSQKVYTRDELIQADIFKDIISDRTIDSHIRRLRRKFSDAGCAEVVETIHGFGYKLGQNV